MIKNASRCDWYMYFPVESGGRVSTGKNNQPQRSKAAILTNMASAADAVTPAERILSGAMV